MNEVPGPTDAEKKVSKAKREHIGKFIKSKTNFYVLPETVKRALTDIVIDIEEVQNREDLLQLAQELDNSDYLLSLFPASQRRQLTKVYEIERAHSEVCCEQTPQEAEESSLKKLREAIAMDQAKIRLAQELGYQPGEIQRLRQDKPFAYGILLCQMIMRRPRQK